MVMAKLRIVQFPHSGKEYVLTKGEENTFPIVKEWNNGPHRRKFLRTKGWCVSGNNILSKNKDLLFWGEWEPYSEVEILNGSNTNPELPTYVHKPFLKIQSNGQLCYYIYRKNIPSFVSAGCLAKLSCTDRSCSKSNRANTDPFVFGDYFIYSCCRQFTKNNKSGKYRYSLMKSLNKGSLILFGSPILNPINGAPYFALDTVFVVGDSCMYHVKNAETDLKGFVPKYYTEIMGYKNWSDNPEMCCYHGATFGQPVNGMYSFVPCKSCNKNMSSWGFERPKLFASMFDQVVKSSHASKDVINVASYRTYRSFDERCCVYFNDQTVYQVWQIVRQEVINQGFELGVRMNYEIR